MVVTTNIYTNQYKELFKKKLKLQTQQHSILFENLNRKNNTLVACTKTVKNAYLSELYAICKAMKKLAEIPE